MPIEWAQDANPRDAWPHEEKDFTPWLAEAENLTKFGKILGLNQLELVRIEHPVGRFFVDIFCTDDQGEVIIENQLEKTDHNHLGQILTYAAGVNAKTIIWIATDIQPEHAAAINFLNENTHEGLNFFAVQLSVTRSGQNFNPNFQIIVNPNNWTRSSNELSRAVMLSTPTTQLQLKYWTAFTNYLDDNQIDLKRPKVQGKGWVPINLGKSGIKICLKVNSQAKNIAVELYIDHPDAKELFNRLKENQDLINQECGLNLDWQELPHAHASRVEYLKTEANIFDESSWEDLFKWHADIAQKFYTVFQPKIMGL
ncbi:DUF4268 domain-containing protein [Polynucleobacter kasalickyi]|uniref:DUF4268 domain-containing protein n=1 Tax=Polynucleobacter kasalickyi TaxID=1938817 RepID=A0A1W2CF47_9BURK|nr:DUF4268 domain-containing protein [Polynucleobacter kasalickyi]SMC83781.1 protein of unknown function [Polynucleobacter kasalickyi]